MLTRVKFTIFQKAVNQASPRGAYSVDRHTTGVGIDERGGEWQPIFVNRAENRSEMTLGTPSKNMAIKDKVFATHTSHRREGRQNDRGGFVI